MTEGDGGLRLCAASVVWLSREGGVAHLPGLARPRRIRGEHCSEAQRVALQALLETTLAAAGASPSAAEGADRRLLRLRIEAGDGAAPREWILAEDQAPAELLDWWRWAEAES